MIFWDCKRSVNIFQFRKWLFVHFGNMNMSTSPISPVNPVSPAASLPGPVSPRTTISEVVSPDGSTVTVVRDPHADIVSIATTPATTPASAVALASHEATGTADAGIHLTA